MAISIDLRLLARKLEKSSDDLLVNASTKSPEVFQKVATAVAAASTLLEGVADDMDNNASFEITPQQLDEIAALASAFDESEDPLLKKQASVLDELLLSIAAPKNAIAISKKTTEDEINRLRSERRKTREEEAYDEPRKVLSEIENAKEQAKAVEQQVKRYIPMEAPLQTRYPPDRPGGQMVRITDHVYQDIVTGIIYDFKAGYKTQKGNDIPGTSVEEQTRALNDNRNQGTSLFETRDSLMGRYAGDDKVVMEKIASVLTTVRDYAPGLLDRAIDNAMDSGLSTDQVATILASNISANGFKVIAAVEDDKKKREPLNCNLSEKESEQEYHNLKRVLQPLSEVIEADPKNAGVWLRMMEDYIETSKNLGLNQAHQSSLYNEFLQPKASEGPATLPPPRNVKSIEDRVARQSLIGLVINATQELAPHLLKSVLAKAQVEGLSDYQIKSVLSSNFSNKFSKTCDEIKVAESILPHLKDLGWNDLVTKHIKAMAGFGVSKSDLQKIANEYNSIDNKSLNRLGNVLKTAGVVEFSPEELGETDTVQVLNPLEEDDEEEEIITQPVVEQAEPTELDLTSLALKVVQIIKSKLNNPEEYHKLRLSKKGNELISAIAYYESNKFKDHFNSRDFSEFANLVQEWAIAELGPKAVKTTKPIEAPVEKKRTINVSPDEVLIQEPKRVEDFDEDSEEFKAAEQEAIDFVAEPGPHKVLKEIFDAENARAKAIFKRIDPNETKAAKIFNTLTLKILERNITGDKKSTNDLFEEILAENRKINYGPWHPKAQEHELIQGSGEKDEQFEERKRNSKARQVSKEQLELELGKSLDEKPLSNDKPASNSTKFQALKWADYQNHWDVFISEAKAAQLENEIADKLREERNQLEEEYHNIIIKTDSTPVSITNLPEDIRNQTNDMLSRGESSRSVSVELSKLNAKLKEENKEGFVVPTVADLSAQRYLLLGTIKDQELDAYRKKMLGRILRRSINEVMKEAGFENPMIEPEEGDNITYPEVRKELQQIIGIEKKAAPFVRKAPIGPEGVPLIQFWQDPTGYWKEFKKTFSGWGDSEKRAQNIAMINAGYNSPDEPVFRYTTTRQMFRNIDPDTTGNILPSFKIPGTNEQYKTLFSDPEEYRMAAMQAKKEFSTVYRDKPAEWNQIVGADPNDIKDIPLQIKRRLAPYAASNMPKKKYDAIAEKLGIDENTAQRIRDYVKQSGTSIKNNIVGMAWSGMSFAEVKAEIEKKFPNAKIPWDAVEYVFENLQSDKEDSEESKRLQNEWMASKGFYPPYQIAVGGLGKDKDRSKSKRREEPVTFASLVFPKKKPGLRDEALKEEGPKLEDLKNKPAKPSVKSKIAPPNTHQTLRQPGVPTVDHRTQQFESLLKGKK